MLPPKYDLTKLERTLKQQGHKVRLHPGSVLHVLEEGKPWIRVWANGHWEMSGTDEKIAQVPEFYQTIQRFLFPWSDLVEVPS